MSENKSESIENQESLKAEVRLGGLYFYKEGMSTWFDEQTRTATAATVLRLEPTVITQIKTISTDGYDAVQLAIGSKSDKNANAALLGHIKSSGMQKAPRILKEVRQAAPEGAEVGSKISIDSLVVGDNVKVIGVSKGKGFAGSVKRYGFAGGPASHGSKFHRQPGSSGNRTWPGRVMPGKKFPGHMGAKTVQTKNLKVLKIDVENGYIVISGAVPGARNSLVAVFRG